MRRGKRTGRRLGIFLSGLATGMVASRILPPLIAAATASRRVRAGGDPFARLIRDHRRIAAILDQMAVVPAGSLAGRSRLYLMLKRKLAKHAMAEEDVVYPIVGNGAAGGDQRKRLYDDHAEIKVLLYQIEEMIKSREDWNTAVLPLRDLVRRHVDEEERVIFPELRRQLAETGSPKVSGQIAREEALVV